MDEWWKHNIAKMDKALRTAKERNTMETVTVHAHLHLSWTCTKCGQHTSHSTLAKVKPNQVECTQCRTTFNAR